MLGLANAADYGTTAGSSTGLTLTTGASANTKGAWTQLAGSLASDTTHLLLTINSQSISGSGNAGVALDLACAGSGSEASGLILQNFVVAGWALVNSQLLLPVGPLPAGSRLAARAQAAAASDTLTIQAISFDAGFSGTRGPSLYDTYGYAGTGVAMGVGIDPGAAANTKGAYSQITGSVANDLCGFFLGFDIQGNNLPTIWDHNTLLVDIAVGASGSEVVVIPNLLVDHQYESDGTYQLASVQPSFTPFLPIPLKAGSRVAARASCSITTPPDRLIGVSLYGLRA